MSRLLRRPAAASVLQQQLHHPSKATDPLAVHSQHFRLHQLHTFLHRRSHIHTHSLSPASSRLAISVHSRSLSFSSIPGFLRAIPRLPVLLVGGAAGTATYIVAQVEAAKKRVFDGINEATSAVGTALGQVGTALGGAGAWASEGVVVVKDYGTGMWSSLRGSVEDWYEASNLGKTGNDDSESGRGGQDIPPTPERIAAAAAIASTLPMAVQADNDENDNDAVANELMMLTKKLIEIRSILLSIDHGEGLQLPAIVVVGSQSSGKSSVLEAVVGREFLPKGNNMVTRRPIELTLIHTPPTPSDPQPRTYAEFPSFAPGQHIFNFTQVQRTLLDLNLSIPSDQAVSSIPVELRIHSPNVPDLSLVDLPGYIEISSMDQPDTLKDEITNLCEKYIKPPNIILAVCAADVDLANSPALRASRRVDPLGMRTIGVITKMDLVEPSHGADILTNKRYPLALGYVGVVCKTVPRLRDQRDPIRVSETNMEGLSGPVRRQEQAFFGGNAREFNREGVQVTTDLLKKRLMHVLEESMANSLHTISNNVGLELEEAKYQFKVQYNDRTVSPESYLAETLDVLKQRLNAISKAYGKTQVRKLLKSYLDDRTMDILAQVYWQDGSESGNLEDLTHIPAKVEELRAKIAKYPDFAKGQTDPDTLWRHKLDAATSALTKSGVGRASTQLVVDAIRSHMSNHLTDEQPLNNHPTTSERISGFSDSILRDRYSITADQVENCIKPYKYEVEFDSDGKEWEKGRIDSIDLLKREIDMCDSALNGIKDSVGGNRRLKNAMQYVSDLEEREKQRVAVQRAAAAKRLSTASGLDLEDKLVEQELIREDTQDPTRTVFNPTLLVKAREAHFLSGRMALLKARMNALKSRQCRSYNEKTADSIRTYCPEVFLNVVADKLAGTAVMFINIELLAEYFYLFPREIETRLGYELSRSEILEFARENPRFKKHIDLQERKEKLQLVMEKLDALLKLQQERQGPIRHVSSSPRSSRRFGLF